MAVLGGNADIVNNNIFENRELEVGSEQKMVLDDNYLGADNINALKLKGDILVASLLTAPYPKGTRVVLVDKEEVTPKVMAERFQKQKNAGINAFKDRKFGDAYQALEKALSLKEDREVYLYLAYTQMIMGDAATSEKNPGKGHQRLSL